uniref:Uncharacterized protein n=1 Tax=Macrostomum lignano TaxID=282301 RepID=A0A1I8FFH2_9PLAT
MIAARGQRLPEPGTASTRLCAPSCRPTPLRHHCEPELVRRQNQDGTWTARSLTPAAASSMRP